mgnify:CR=1 FL=1
MQIQTDIHGPEAGRKGGPDGPRPLRRRGRRERPLPLPHRCDAPEVDGNVCVSSEEPLYPGEFYDVLVDDSDLYDLYGTVVK